MKTIIPMYQREFFYLDGSVCYFSIDEIAKNLKSEGVWVNAVDDKGDTPLHIAAKNNEISLVRSMLPHARCVDKLNEQGDTILHIFISNYNMSDSEEKHTNTLRSLLSKNTWLNKKHQIIRTLLSKGADVNKKNKQGMTPAYLAVKYGCIDALKIFKKSKKSIDVFSDDYDSMLHLICKNDELAWKDIPEEVQIEVMSYLIEQGCDVNAMDKQGFSPLHYALQTRNANTVKKLIQLGFDVDCWKNKVLLNQMLMTASSKCNISVVQFLIQQGADVNTKDEFGRQPLHMAATRSFQQYDTMKELLKSGAHVDDSNNYGHVPLYLALKYENVAALECLMEFGVDVINTSAFRRIPIGHIMDSKPLESFLLQHLTKLEVAGFKINKIYEPYLKREDLRIYKRRCMEEVNELKLSMVDNDTTLYDLLHMKTTHCHSAHLPKLLRHSKLSFPLYYGIIRIKIYEIERKSLIKPASLAWYQLTKINLPYPCVEKILSNLSSCCLRKMINNANDYIFYDSVLLEAKSLEA